MHRRKLLGLGATLLLIAVACTPGASSPTPPAGSGSPGTGGTPAAGGGQTVTLAVDGEIDDLSNAADDVPTFEAALWLYNALYTYDDQLTPVPDLAAELAEISPDGKTWTIALKDGVKFHDGSTLTADDVVFTYQLAQSINCRFNPSVCLNQFLDKVEKVDDKTVKFTLKQKYAPFATLNLPAIFIDSKAYTEASYERFLTGTRQVTPADAKALVDKYAAEDEKPACKDDGTCDYGQFNADAKALIEKAGVELPTEDCCTTEGVLDENAYGVELRGVVEAINLQFTADEIDAIAAAYTLLDIQRKPMGTGPFKFVEFKPGESLTYDRFDDYFAGKPQISKMFLPIIKEEIAAGSALKAGQIDWKYSLEGSTYNSIKDDPGLKFAEYPDFGYFSLYFNVRDGRLFADRNLRQAVSYCFDKPKTVEAATGGAGVAVYGDIPPASWAYNPNVEKYEENTDKAKELIEASGWTLGSDGVYEKGGKKLATKVLVRAGKADRIQFMQLLRDQVKRCGIDLTVQEADFQTVLIPMIDNYPHIPPGDSQPFDAYFGGFSTGFDPDPFSTFHSSQATGPLPDGTIQNETFNYIGWKNEKADELIEAGLVELDQSKRAEIYKQFEELLAEDLPVLFAWSDIAREGLAGSMNDTDNDWTPDNMDTPTWFWEVQKITNLKGAN
jgi:ABC-type transport system substrate-binding protein